jgi:undecaprenyl-diphosphatase
MNSIDIFIQNYFSVARTVGMTELMYLLTVLFDLSVLFIVVTFCVGILVCKIRNFKYTLLFWFTLIFGAFSTYVLKSLFNVNRPLDAVMSAFGQSFPSYHTTIATIFFVILIYTFDSHLKNPIRVIFNFICIAGIILVSFSRVYLGVHWLSDVLGGVALGLIISYIAIVIFKRFYK